MSGGPIIIIYTVLFGGAVLAVLAALVLRVVYARFAPWSSRTVESALPALAVWKRMRSLVPGYWESPNPRARSWALKRSQEDSTVLTLSARPLPNAGIEIRLLLALTVFPTIAWVAAGQQERVTLRVQERGAGSRVSIEASVARSRSPSDITPAFNLARSAGVGQPRTLARYSFSTSKLGCIRACASAPSLVRSMRPSV